MWSRTRPLLDAIAALKAENSDLRAQVRFLTQAHHDRETKLIDRILAVSHPAALAQVEPRPPREPKHTTGPPRVNFPGLNLSPPPVPRTEVLVNEPEDPEKKTDGN